MNVHEFPITVSSSSESSSPAGRDPGSDSRRMAMGAPLPPDRISGFPDDILWNMLRLSDVRANQAILTQLIGENVARGHHGTLAGFGRVPSQMQHPRELLHSQPEVVRAVRRVLPAVKLEALRLLRGPLPPQTGPGFALLHAFRARCISAAIAADDLATVSAALRVSLTSPNDTERAERWLYFAGNVRGLVRRNLLNPEQTHALLRTLREGRDFQYPLNFARASQLSAITGAVDHLAQYLPPDQARVVQDEYTNYLTNEAPLRSQRPDGRIAMVDLERLFALLHDYPKALPNRHIDALRERLFRLDRAVVDDGEALAQHFVQYARRLIAHAQQDVGPAYGYMYRAILRGSHSAANHAEFAMMNTTIMQALADPRLELAQRISVAAEVQYRNHFMPFQGDDPELAQPIRPLEILGFCRAMLGSPLVTAEQKIPLFVLLLRCNRPSATQPAIGLIPQELEIFARGFEMCLGDENVSDADKALLVQTYVHHWPGGLRALFATATPGLPQRTAELMRGRRLLPDAPFDALSYRDFLDVVFSTDAYRTQDLSPDLLQALARDKVAMSGL